MITSKQCLERYGDPKLERAMVLFDIPTHLEIGVIPKKIYCNRELIAPLTRALTNLIERGLVGQLKTWDGVFNLRKKKGGSTPSLHSWGLAVDVNAAWNRFGTVGNMTPEFVKCFTDAGFDWGGIWHTRDDMHFQLKEFPHA